MRFGFASSSTTNMIVSSEDGRTLRSHKSLTGQSITLSDSTGYTMVCVLPVSPVLVAAMELEADRFYWISVLRWLLGPKLTKNTLPRREPISSTVR